MQNGQNHEYWIEKAAGFQVSEKLGTFLKLNCRTAIYSCKCCSLYSVGDMPTVLWKIITFYKKQKQINEHKSYKMKVDKKDKIYNITIIRKCTEEIIMRRRIRLNTGWYFAKTEKIVKDIPKDWEAITLPHTWNKIDGQDGGNDYYRGTCMYVKELKNPELAAGEHAFLEFEGAAMTADVYVNGEKLAHHEGGYSTFRVDITNVITEKMILCVAVDNSANDTVYPQKADFTFYGGIYRDVNLLILPEKHFEVEKDGTSGIKVTPKVVGNRAVVSFESWQNCDGEVTYTILAPEGFGYEYWKGIGTTTALEECSQLVSAIEVASTTSVSVDGYARAELVIENVNLWNGLTNPYLYVAKAKTDEDCVLTRFGCREFSFDKEKGFYLNGESYPLRGVSRHQDRAGVGNALTPKMHEEDLEMILDMGANTIRLAHYQHAQYFYDLCDAAGIVTWAEIPYITQHMPNGRANTLSQMRELVTQCYHHPSIVCWGLSNEITASGPVTDDLMENHRLLNELCHSMDVTRPTTMAHVFMLETESPLIDIADIGSYNLYFGWYLGELSQNDSFFDEFHQKYPNRIIGFSEYGADANPQYQSEKPERGDYTESYQCVYHEHLLKCIEERPYLWATHMWNMFDFAADGRDEGGKNGQNQKGLVTMDRQLKKDAFYLYKAYWNQKDAFLHICGSRFVERTSTKTEVKVYTNQNYVELYVDGILVECKEGTKVFQFEVSITGEHKIEARSGACSDFISIRKVEKANPVYAMLKQEEVVNWFDKDSLDVTCFSIEDTMGEITSTTAGAAILERIMAKARASRGDVAEAASGNSNLQKMMAGMKLSSLLKQAGNAISAEDIVGLNAALQKIKKPVKQKLVLNVDSRLSQIFAYEETKAVFDQFLPGMRARVESQPATLGFSLRKLVSYSGGAIPETVLDKMEEALSKVELDELEEKGYSENQPLIPEAAITIEETIHTAIVPGKPWRDTTGKRIQAHAGALFYENDTYYWYGENKDRTDGKCPVWTWGIRAYASKDLYNWEDLGLIIKPDLKNPKAGLYPEKHVDRPHILKCDTTGKYVCWIKQSGEEACFLILQADTFTGPYQVVKEEYRPMGAKVGDFDIVRDEESKKAYLFFDADHTGIIGMKLSEDFLSAEKEVSKQYEELHAPFCREAVALFERNGKKYMLTSGMSGYIPNKSDAAISNNWEDAFVSVGNPHVNDASNASFNSQISQVFKVPGKKDLYIAIADRWVPEYIVDAKRADILERAIAAHYEPKKYHVTAEEQKEVMSSPMLESANTSIADYVWLPLQFDGDKVQIAWFDQWRIEDFE